MKTALLAGATGLVGKQLMYKLLENKEYEKVIILVRRPYQIKHPKLEQIITNFTDLDKLLFYTIPNEVFCCLGTTMARAGSKEEFYKVDFTYVFNLANFFSEKGSSQFLMISSNGANTQSSFYYPLVKGEIEHAVSALKYNCVHIFRPSILMGNRAEFRFGERMGIALALVIQPFMLGNLKKYRPIHASKVAEAMLNSALENNTGIYVHESDEIQSVN